MQSAPELKVAEAQAVLRENQMFDYPTPWIGYTAIQLSLCPHDSYADWAGWRSWMMDQGPRDDDSWWDWFDNFEEPNVSWLYRTMSDACRMAAEACGWKEAHA